MSDHVHGPDCAHGHGVPVKLGAVGGKEPCPCGSGKKYKHCCYTKDAAAAAAAAAAAPATIPETPAAADGESAEKDEAEEAPEAKVMGKPKAPVIARGPVMAPRTPPHGSAAKAKRSGHRKV